MTTFSELSLIGIGHAQSIEGANVEPHTANLGQRVILRHFEHVNVIVNESDDDSIKA
jgi:hypothetical protein